MGPQLCSCGSVEGRSYNTGTVGLRPWHCLAIIGRWWGPAGPMLQQRSSAGFQPAAASSHVMLTVLTCRLLASTTSWPTAARTPSQSCHPAKLASTMCLAARGSGRRTTLQPCQVNAPFLQLIRSPAADAASVCLPLSAGVKLHTVLNAHSSHCTMEATHMVLLGARDF